MASLDEDEDDVCSYDEDMYIIAAAVQILRPELALGRAVRDLMDDPRSRLTYLARDMLEACLLPLIPRMNAFTDPDELKNRIKRVQLPKCAGKVHAHDLTAFQQNFSQENYSYGDLLEACSELVGGGRRVTTIDMGRYQFIITKYASYVAQADEILHRYDNERSTARNWHYVGYGIFLWFRSQDFDPDKEIYSFAIGVDGRLSETDHWKLLGGVSDINVMPCGLAYCTGVKDSNSFETQPWYRLIDFSVYPPKALKVEQADCGNCTKDDCCDEYMWDYIDDYGRICIYPDSAETCARVRSRSSNWISM